MKKSVLSGLVLMLILSGCGKYNSFTQRKYFDYKQGETAIVKQQKEQTTETEKGVEMTASVNNVSEKNDAIETETSKDLGEKNVTATENSNLKKAAELPAKGGLMAVKKEGNKKMANRIVNKLIQQKISYDDGEPKVKGKIWFVFLILFVAFFIIALFVSALPGTILGIISFALFIAMLAVFATTKHKQSKWRMEHRNEMPREQPSPRQKEAPPEPKKKRG